MQRMKYKITTLASVVFSKESGDRNMTETFDYIPGRVVLGIFAGKLIKKNNLRINAHEIKDFKNYFLKDDITFTNAYVRMNNDKPTVVTPYSIQFEKDKPEKIHDLLFKTEKELTKYWGGYCYLDDESITNENVNKSLNFHHARDENTGASKEGMIFNYESIDKDQVFEGFIIGDKNLIESFRKNFEKQFTAYTGRSKTSQYGKIKFEFVSDPEDYNSEAKIDSNISLTFLSDTLLYNDNGASVCDIETLEKYLQSKISTNLKVNKSFIKPSRVDNFISVWKLKKPSEVCFSSGSCFLLNGLKETDIENMKLLEIYGIGERKNEGFGRIIFSLQKSEVLNKASMSEEKIEKPNSKVPELSKEFIKAAIKNIIIREVKSRAIRDANTFNNDNIDKNTKSLKDKLTKSLIGRLESFIKDSANLNEFKQSLDSLRKPAKDKLQGCKMNNKNYLEYLVSKNIIVNDFISTTHLNSLSNELLKNIYDLSQDSELNNKLFKIYYLAFFAYLRRLIKKEDYNRKENNNG